MGNAAQKVERYLELRRQKEETEKRFKERFIKPLETEMDALENELLEYLEAEGLQHVACSNGTAYRSMFTSATVKDWGATLDFIREREAWDMLEARVSKNAVEAMLEESGELPPGVSINRRYRLGVRKA